MEEGKRERHKGYPTTPRIMITAWGETKHLMAWSRDPRCKCSAKTLLSRLERLHRIWSAEEAISTPANQELEMVAIKKSNARQYEGYGESKTVEEWLKDPRCNAKKQWFLELLKRGVPLEQALEGSGPQDYLRRGRTLTAWGETKLVSHWLKDPRCKVGNMTFYKYLNQGVDPELIMSGVVAKKPVGPRKKPDAG